MKITFAYDRRYGPPYPIIPLIESGFSEKSVALSSTVVKKRECKEEDLAFDTVDGKDADILLGGEAPDRQVLDMQKILWDPDKRALTVSYLPQEDAKVVDYKSLDCDKEIHP
jgi:azurin